MNISNKLLLIAIGIISFATSSTAQETELNQREFAVESFSNIVERLDKRTGLPLELPSFLSNSNQQLYSRIGAITPQFYGINLNDNKECLTTGYIQDCNIIILSAQKKGIEIESLEETAQHYQNLIEEAGSQKEVKKITLGSNGEVEGILTPRECSADSCKRREIIFDKGGIRYTIQKKDDEPESVIKIANSWINNPVTGEDFN